MSPTIAEIIEQYKLRIFKTCLGYSNNIEDAKDLTQEVFINIWKGLKSFRGDSSLNTWIYRITVNTCLMYIRRRKNKKIALEQINFSILEDISTTGDYKEEDLKELYRMIAGLNEKDRLIILLYLEELSYHEIAEIIGITINYVGVRINRIKKILSNQMKQL